jgi:riboflavin synthase
LALNGASLTVAGIDRANCRFRVNLIPETLKRTNFGLLEEGDRVNVEVEHQTQVIVDTITRLMQEGILEQVKSIA